MTAFLMVFFKYLLDNMRCARRIYVNISSKDAIDVELKKRPAQINKTMANIYK